MSFPTVVPTGYNGTKHSSIHKTSVSTGDWILFYNPTVVPTGYSGTNTLFNLQNFCLHWRLGSFVVIPPSSPLVTAVNYVWLSPGWSNKQRANVKFALLAGGCRPQAPLFYITAVSNISLILFSNARINIIHPKSNTIVAQ